MHFLNLSGRFATTAKVGLCSVIALAALAGCNNSGTGDDSAANKTRITSTDGPTKRETKISGTATKPTGEQKPHTVGVATADDVLTQSMFLISGQVKFEDGAPVTTGTVKAVTFERPENGAFQTRESAPVPISGEGVYQVKTPAASAVTMLFEGEFPSTYEGVPAEKIPGKPVLKKIKQDITVARGVEVRGRVVDDKNQPVINALVSLRSSSDNHGSRASEVSTSSTANGEFVLPYVRRGKATAMAFHKDLVTGIQAHEVPTTEPLVITMLTDGATVTGHVYRQETGHPQAGVTVSVIDKVTYKPKETKSQADGSFRIDKIRPGLNALAASSTDPRLGTYPVDGEQVNQQIKLADKETTEINLMMYGGHSLTGKVTDKETGDPIAEAAIYTQDGTTSSTSAADGSYKLQPVFPGTTPGFVTISAKKDGYILVNEERYQPGLINAYCTIDELAPVLDLPMIKTVSVSGTVKSADGIPVPNAEIQIVDQRGGPDKAKTTTAGDGTYKLEVKPFYDAAVKANAAGFAPGNSEAFHVDNADISGVDITLEVGATISGVVVDPEGKPIAGAGVATYSMIRLGNSSMGDSNGSSKSDASGAFTILNLPRSVSISASHENYASAKTEQLELTPGDVKSGIRLALQKGFNISGKVVDADDKPVQGAWVYCYGGGSSVNSGADGTFLLKQVPEGSFRLQASGSGGSAQLESVKAGSENVILKYERQQKRDSARLIGTVVDEVTNEPLEKFELRNLVNSKKDPSRKGGFIAEELAQGVTVAIEVTAPGYPKVNVTVQVPKQPQFEYTLKVGKGGAITGTLVDSGSKAPIPDVLVINWGRLTSEYERQSAVPESSVRTDAEGKFTLAPAPAGTNNFVVRTKAPFTEFSKTITVKNDEVADAGIIEVDRGGTIYGKVTLGKGNEPVANTMLYVNGSAPNGGETTRKTVTTDAEGNYRIEGLPALNYSIYTSKASIRESVVLGVAEEKEVNIHIGGTTVIGNVTRGGQPISCMVSASKTSGEKLQASGRTNAGEPYKITGLTPGEWKFFVYPIEENNTGRSNEFAVTIPDQEEFKKDFVLPDIHIAGVVVDSNGEPVPGAQVQLSQKQTSAGGGDSWRGGYNASLTTKADGRFSFNSVVEGTYQVFAKKDGVGSAMESSVTPRDGAPVDLRLQLDPVGGTLVSIVLNMADGTGLQPAWCYLYGENGRFTHASQRDAAGIMRIENIPAGTYTANVSSWGFSQSERSVEIKRGETVTIEDVLYAAGAIEWTLAKADGSPADATGTATPLDQGSIEQPKQGSSAGGKLVIRGLAPGNYQVSAQIAGKPAISDTFTVIAGDIARKSTTVPTW